MSLRSATIQSVKRTTAINPVSLVGSILMSLLLSSYSSKCRDQCDSTTIGFTVHKPHTSISVLLVGSKKFFVCFSMKNSQVRIIIDAKTISVEVIIVSSM